MDPVVAVQVTAKLTWAVAPPDTLTGRGLLPCTLQFPATLASRMV